jgi:hypothetical protein
MSQPHLTRVYYTGLKRPVSNKRASLLWGCGSDEAKKKVFDVDDDSLLATSGIDPVVRIWSPLPDVRPNFIKLVLFVIYKCT